MSQTQICIRKRDEYGNRHDVLNIERLVKVRTLAEITHRGQTDYSMTIITEDLKLIKYMSFDHGRETICYEYDIDISEACKYIKSYQNAKNVRVWIDQSFEETCEKACEESDSTSSP
jgi:aryl-phospho-beta-D-glucosidase BglC (GH1 family)